ncbi:tetratricopeptide repeat protein [Lentimicrobium sp. S6]|nr:tetratricopeptide repeat protein [Lentimicrobium sp. S6]
MQYKPFLLIFLFLLIYGSSFSQSRSAIDSLELALNRINDDTQKCDILLNITDLIISSEPDKALDYAQKSLVLSRENEDSHREIKAYLQLAEIYWSKTDFKTSLEYAYQAKGLAAKEDYQKEYAESILIITQSFFELGDYKKSSNMNFEALKTFEKINDKKGVMNALNKIGVDFFSQDDSDKALEYYKQSLNMAREINDLEGISRGLNNTAVIYGNRGDIEKVKANYFASVAINKKLGNHLGEGVNYLNLGMVNANENNDDSTLYYYRKAESLFTGLNNFYSLSDLYLKFALHHTKLKQTDSVLFYSQQALKIGKENNIKLVIYGAAFILKGRYLELSDFQKAYEYSELQYQIKDSLDFENNKTRLSQLEFLYEQDKINQEKKIKQQRREFSFSLVSGIIIMFFLVLFIIQRNKTKRKSLEQKNTLLEKEKISKELEFRNKELATNVMYSIEKNNMLRNISDELFNIEKEAVKEETQNAIQRISKRIYKSIEEGSWEEFEIRFQQVHTDFYENLSKDFPDLSTNEKRLCGFLRLEMTSKEISKITGQSISALETARLRLRKKLGITKTKVSLNSFLSNY